MFVIKCQHGETYGLGNNAALDVQIAEGASDAALQWGYKNYVSMIQKLLGIKTGTRDELPPDLLYELGKVQQMAKLIIRGLRAKGVISRQIYVGTKSKLENYAQLSMFNQRFLGRSVTPRLKAGACS